jgi:anti-sigma-K factor RskA
MSGVFWRRLDAARNAALVAQLDLERELSARDSLLASLRGPRVHVVSLAAPSGGAPVARVFWNHEQRRFVVTAFALPPTSAGRTYQLWAIAEGKAPVSMGTFDTSTEGVATVALAVGADIEAMGVIKLCAVTQEPAGGSAGPTETPRFVGEWRHTD